MITQSQEVNVPVLLTALVFIASYLLGSIPIGLLLTRAATGRDIRTIGSGRTGATNVLRSAGPLASALTILGDGAKGFLAVHLARLVLGTPVAEAVAGLVAVFGHNYSVFIQFRGGAGTVATVGGAIALWPWNALLIALGGGAIATTRFASVGSISIAIALPIILAVRAARGDAPWVHLVYGVGTSLLTLWALRPNIGRLIAGCERRVELQKAGG